MPFCWFEPVLFPDAKPLPFPAELAPWLIANFSATRVSLRKLLGDPHYVEKDSTQTAGGEEDNWAYEFPDGTRVLIALQDSYNTAMVYADPKGTSQALKLIAPLVIDREIDVLSEPLLDPCYTGPTTYRDQK